MKNVALILVLIHVYESSIIQGKGKCILPSNGAAFIKYTLNNDTDVGRDFKLKFNGGQLPCVVSYKTLDIQCDVYRIYTKYLKLYMDSKEVINGSFFWKSSSSNCECKGFLSRENLILKVDQGGLSPSPTYTISYDVSTFARDKSFTGSEGHRHFYKKYLHGTKKSLSFNKNEKYSIDDFEPCPPVSYCIQTSYARCTNEPLPHCLDFKDFIKDRFNIKGLTASVNKNKNTATVSWYMDQYDFKDIDQFQYSLYHNKVRILSGNTTNTEMQIELQPSNETYKVKVKACLPCFCSQAFDIKLELPLPTISPSKSQLGEKKNLTTEIVSGIIGALVFLAIAIIAALKFLRQRKYGEKCQAEEEIGPRKEKDSKNENKFNPKQPVSQGESMGRIYEEIDGDADYASIDYQVSMVPKKNLDEVVDLVTGIGEPGDVNDNNDDDDYIYGGSSSDDD
eukprot:TCONS_00025860-protein